MGEAAAADGGAPSDDDLEELVAGFVFKLSEDPSFDLDEYVASQPEALRAELTVRCGEARHLQALFADDRPEGSEEEKGQRLGHYLLLRPLGQGSMAKVFLARDTRPESGGVEVALKVLRGPAGVFGRAEARFRREALTLAKLDHPGIARVHEIGEADGKLFISMEYVAGRTLESHLNSERAARFPRGLPVDEQVDDIDVARVAELIGGLAEALQAAHEHDVVHRDLKPGNIMIDEAGSPRVLDFGLARDMAEASISAVGDLTGTPHYMSPEQAGGRREGLDQRADVFSLGVLLFELLTLRRPFEATDLEGVLERIAHDEPTPVRRLNPTVPADLASICGWALRKDPDLRYATAAALAGDLRAFREHRALANTPEDPAALVVASGGGARRGWALGALVTALLALALTFATDWWEGRTLRSRAQDLPKPEAFEDLPPDQAAAVVLRARQLAAMGADDAVADLITAARRRGEFELRAWEDARTRAFQTVAEDTVPAEAGDLVRGARHLATATLLLGESADDGLGAPALSDLLGPRGLQPRISVLTDQVGDQVQVRRLDPRLLSPLGTWAPLGDSPIIAQPIAPGAWQVRATRSSADMSDTVRWLDMPRSVVEIVLRVPPVDQVTEGMLRIGTRAFTYGRAGAEAPLAETRTALPAFWIDRTEVSRGEYRAFLLESGRAPPPDWGDDDAERDGLPATGMTLSEARAYAMWMGKRLPTAAEWERAARGTMGLEQPNESEHAGAERVGPVAVSVDAAGPGPEGLLHTAGNVAEWTASPWIDANGRPRRAPGLVVQVKGGSWRSGGGLRLSDAEGVSAGTRRADLGFRCARSVAP